MLVRSLPRLKPFFIVDTMQESDFTELSIPPDVIADGGDEVLRAFVINGGLSIAIQRAFQDPATWGRLLMDVAHYVAGLYGRETEISEQEALAEILAVMKIEIDKSENSDSLGNIN